MAAKGQKTRQQIVAAALKMASRVGLASLTLGTLAEELKLSKSGLFAHFRSKEALQLAVLEEAILRFRATVTGPALEKPRGLPQVRAVFDNYLQWIRTGLGRSGCFFHSLSLEYDDRPGAVRDRLLGAQKDWAVALARFAQGAVAEGDFRADLDVQQFAYEVQSLGMGFQHAYKLLEDPEAEARARAGFQALVSRASQDKSRNNKLARRA